MKRESNRKKEVEMNLNSKQILQTKYTKAKKKRKKWLNKVT